MTTPSLSGPDFSKNGGLLPAIAQDAQTGEVLMLAWMNAESFAETVRTGNAVYYSRSRGKLWRKGEESGHVQTVREIYIDCDADTILLKVDQVGAACHEGYRSCFFRIVTKEGMQVVSERLVEPEKVYGKPLPPQVKMYPLLSHPQYFHSFVGAQKGPLAANEGSMFSRTFLALAYFGFLTFFFVCTIPHYSTVPLVLLGIAGLMILAVMLAMYWTAPTAKDRRQITLITFFIFTAACAMLLGTVTGLVRAIGRPVGPPEFIAATLLSAVLLFFSFPFAGYLAEALVWTAAHLIRIPRVRSVVRRLIP